MAKLVYQDAEIETNWNGTKFHVRCRGFERRDLTQDQLAELVYPALDALANAEKVSGGSNVQASEETKS